MYMYMYIYIHTVEYYTREYYSIIKKNKNLSFSVTWMDLEGVMLGEISQTETDKYYTI